MRLRQIKMICWSTGMLLLFGAGSVLAWAFYAPCEVTTSDSDSTPGIRPVSSADSGANESPAPTLEDFQPLLAKRLRRALFDPPPVVKKPPPKKKLPQLKEKLLATMINSDSKTAMFISGSGDTLFRQEGQSIGSPDTPAEILEIHSQHVVLQYGDEKKTMTIEGGE